MRDAQSALDQVIAFAGTTITSEDVSTVLGLVGRDLLFDMTTAVADEDAAAAFTLTGRAVEAGYDLKLVCRELSRLVRDLLLLKVDPSRGSDPEVAAERDRGRLAEMAARFSREDLLRAFDVLARAEQEVRVSAQPRYHVEMALLRWIHLRKLTPIEDVIAGLDRGTLGAGPAPGGARPPGGGFAPGSRPAAPAGPPGNRPPFGQRTSGFPPKPGGPQATVTRLQEARAGSAAAAPARAVAPAPQAVAGEPMPAEAADLPPDFADRFVGELRRTKAAFFGMVMAQAQTVECDGRRLVVTFAPGQEHLRAQIDARRGDLEGLAAQLAGRRVAVVSARGVAPSPNDPAPRLAEPPSPPPPPPAGADLRAQALADANVQALLEVIPVEIRDVEEL
jgi:DNA polymerase-3 subunit gamma/tau